MLAGVNSFRRNITLGERQGPGLFAGIVPEGAAGTLGQPGLASLQSRPGPEGTNAKCRYFARNWESCTGSRAAPLFAGLRQPSGDP